MSCEAFLSIFILVLPEEATMVADDINLSFATM